MSAPPQTSSDKKCMDEAYWRAHWQTDETKWRVFERDANITPFERYTTAALDAAASATSGTTTPSDEKITPAKLRGARVVVPLCGDSPVLRYFFDLGCHVTGMEFDTPTVRRAARELFPGASIVEEALPADVCGTSDGVLLRITRDGATIAAAEGLSEEERSRLAALPPATAHYFSGDFYSVAEALTKPNNIVSADPQKFEVVYDRGSFVATAPEGRLAYAAAIEGLAATAAEMTASVFAGRHGTLHMMIHLVWKAEENWGNGPPFHTPTDTVLVPTFQKCKIVPALGDDAHPFPAEVRAKFPFAENVTSMLWFS